MEFEGDPPQGYGVVSLSATLNGVDLGSAWSQQPRYTEDTEHAEDAVVDLIEKIQFFMGVGGYPSGSQAYFKPYVETVANAAHVGNRSDLVINDLTASPCSSRYGTCGKTNAKGCAERLMSILDYGLYNVTVNADHYYQPHGVVDAKKKSADACAEMRTAGITVNIART